MRIFSAALLGAAAALPTLVYATSSLPDPTDAAALVPAARVPSAFADYRPYQDKPPGSWKELNKAAMNGTGMAGMSGRTDKAGMAGMPGMPGMAGIDHGQMPAGGAGAKKGEQTPEQGGANK
jgi:hypothetical protein